MDKKKISERFRGFIRRLGFKQSEFARDISVRPQTIHDYCSGKTYPSAKIMAMIATKYGVDINWLLTGQGNVLPQDAEYNPDLHPVGDHIRDVLRDPNLNTTPENFAKAGEISVEELTAILENRMPLPMHTARKWALTYRINLNFLGAGIGYPLLTRGQFEQNGPLMALRKRNGEDEYPPGAGNPDYAEAAESIDSDLYDGLPYQPDRHKQPKMGGPIPDAIPQGSEIPIIGLAQCGATGWSTTTQLAVATSAPVLREGILAAMAIGDSMLPAGIQPGNIVYCDPRLTPQKGDPVLVRRRGLAAENEGDATLKIWEGRDEDWIYLQGWQHKKDSGTQEEFRIKQNLVEVIDISPVVLVRRKI